MRTIKIITLVICLFGFLTSIPAQHYKKDGTPDKRYKENKTSTYKSSASKPSSTKKSYSTSTGVKRDKSGKIARSASAKNEFMKKSGYPKGRKGYVVDHIIPLKKGGCDCPSNMQWQTIKEAKAKDKVEAP